MHKQITWMHSRWVLVCAFCIAAVGGLLVFAPEPLLSDAPSGELAHADVSRAIVDPATGALPTLTPAGWGDGSHTVLAGTAAAVEHSARPVSDVVHRHGMTIVRMPPHTRVYVRVHEDVGGELQPGAAP